MSRAESIGEFSVSDEEPMAIEPFVVMKMGREDQICCIDRYEHRSVRYCGSENDGYSW